MTGANRMVCQAATLLVFSLTLTSAPAKAQFTGFGDGGDGDMTQMAPMLEMMKAKIGKRRFAMVMQTMGPMMSRMRRIAAAILAECSAVAESPEASVPVRPTRRKTTARTRAAAS